MNVETKNWPAKPSSDRRSARFKAHIFQTLCSLWRDSDSLKREGGVNQKALESNYFPSSASKISRLAENVRRWPGLGVPVLRPSAPQVVESFCAEVLEVKPDSILLGLSSPGGDYEERWFPGSFFESQPVVDEQLRLQVLQKDPGRFIFEISTLAPLTEKEVDAALFDLRSRTESG